MKTKIKIKIKMAPHKPQEVVILYIYLFLLWLKTCWKANRSQSEIILVILDIVQFMYQVDNDTVFD